MRRTMSIGQAEALANQALTTSACTLIDAYLDRVASLGAYIPGQSGGRMWRPAGKPA